MVPSSYLRIYQPLGSFPPEEREIWERYVASAPQHPIIERYRHVAFNEGARTGVLFPAQEEHAYIRDHGGKILVCPWRTKLRSLVGLLAYRNSVPAEAADLWVPEAEALKAAGELEQLREEQPEMLNNITVASWHVPLRWFIAFDSEERIVIEENGRLRVRYETDLRSARTRLDRGLKILREAGMADSQCEPVADLLEWVAEFPYDSVLELDYGTVADLFSREDLILDRSGAEMWECLEALALGDYESSADTYNDLASVWNRVKSLELAN